VRVLPGYCTWCLQRAIPGQKHYCHSKIIPRRVHLSSLQLRPGCGFSTVVDMASRASHTPPSTSGFASQAVPAEPSVQRVFSSLLRCWWVCSCACPSLPPALPAALMPWLTAAAAAAAAPPTDQVMPLHPSPAPTPPPRPPIPCRGPPEQPDQQQRPGVCAGSLPSTPRLACSRPTPSSVRAPAPCSSAPGLPAAPCCLLLLLREGFAHLHLHGRPCALWGLHTDCACTCAPAGKPYGSP